MIESSKPKTNRGNVLITGATSGIGRATAELLAQSGFRVFGTGRHPENQDLDGVTFLPLEITLDQSVQNCVEEALRQTNGRIDVLINNVGTGILGAAEESSADQVRELFDINFFGAVRITNAVLPTMRTQKHGKIVIMSSAGGIASLPFSGYYCATKHAIEAYGEALRLELDPFNIRVSIVAPGTVSTPAGDKAIEPDRPINDYEPKRRQMTDAYVDAIHKGMAPGYVAKAILRILEMRNPRSRYEVGLQSRLATALKSLLPARVFEAGVKRSLK